MIIRTPDAEGNTQRRCFSAVIIRTPDAEENTQRRCFSAVIIRTPDAEVEFNRAICMVSLVSTQGNQILRSAIISVALPEKDYLFQSFRRAFSKGRVSPSFPPPRAPVFRAFCRALRTPRYTHNVYKIVLTNTASYDIIK